MSEMDTRKAVRQGYGKIARQEGQGCCCGGCNTTDTISKKIGYSEEELEAVPDGANLGLGCGNPVALASLKPGDVVLDLGSGAGFDCFLASEKVGEKGRVIGVDMTPDMLDKARENARKGNYRNIEFRLGEIENLPVADSHVDAIISNCVINLSTDKPRVFAEAFRVLKPGGRLMVSDIVVLKELPAKVRTSIAAYVGCISGAIKKDQYLNAIKKAGFTDAKIVEETPYPIECMENDPTAHVIIDGLGLTHEELQEVGRSILSVKVSAVKPG